MQAKTPTTSLYIQPGRLSDVLALIQVLAYDKWAKRSNEGLTTQLRRDPLTSPTWTDIGRQHPELFRVLEAERHQSGQETVTLIARFVQEETPGATEGEPGRLPPLTPEVTSKLMELAVQLYDREVQRKDRWKSVLVPTIVAVIAAAASVTAAILTSSQKGECKPTIVVTSAAAPPERPTTAVPLAPSPMQPAIQPAAPRNK